MLNSKEKIKYLKILVDKSIYVTKEDSNDPEFEKWKNLVERTFIKVFGEDSVELKQFNKLLFYFPVEIMNSSESDYIANHLSAFRKDFKILKDSIEQYIGELLDEVDGSESKESKKMVTNNRIFISHASADLPIVEEIIELLESIGLTSTQIFCTSFEGYGIGLGDDFLKTLKDELEGNTLVVFILSKSFYKSPICLCEMGAAWVLSKSHIPILIPP
ncbi:MAG TPA: toll/interleukin-1 receptor domain-containing protein, partial [Arcobacter sp.]|nr:toll/interleukin-1 receptor domain-containing protein [Arcobacter sp.]